MTKLPATTGVTVGDGRRRWPARAALWIAAEDRPLALLTGVLALITTMAPVFPLHCVVLLPVLVTLDRAPTIRAAIGRALFGGMAIGCLICLWVLSLIVYSFLAPFLYLLTAAWIGAFMTLPLAAGETLRRRLGWPVWTVLPPLWVLKEYVLGLGEMGLTADGWFCFLSFYPSLLQYAEWTGPLGAALWAVAVNALLFECWRRFRSGRRPAAAAAGTAALALAIVVPVHGARRMEGIARQAEREPRQVEVAVVQPSIDLFVKHDPAHAKENRELVVGLARAASAGADLVVIPESVLPGKVMHRLARSERPDAAPLGGLARETGVPIVVGRLYYRIRSEGDFDAYNAAFLVGTDGEVHDWYGKIRLVPIIEGLPYLHYLGLRRIPLGGGSLFGQLGGFSVGPRETPLPVPPVRRGPPLDVPGEAAPGETALRPAPRFRTGVTICFEALFSDLPRRQVRAGAEMMLCLSEDSWYLRSYFGTYMNRMLMCRAIETRRSWARAANTGVSGFVTPDGTYHDATPLWQQRTVRRRLPLMTGETFYVRHGEWLAAVAAAWIALAALVALRRGAS